MLEEVAPPNYPNYNNIWQATLKLDASLGQKRETRQPFEQSFLWAMDHRSIIFGEHATTSCQRTVERLQRVGSAQNIQKQRQFKKQQ